MRENLSEVLVGAAVLAVAAGFLAYSARVTGFSTGGADGYALTASFRSAEGITLGTDVRMSGVKVGSVTGLALNAETFRADTTLSFDGDVPLVHQLRQGQTNRSSLKPNPVSSGRT